ncbi:MAG: iron ABC transporter substrate-binding protein [Methanomicrobiaceae archaeon]|nr:iron ABC transporter substrate-binding protein [Methanomicrobiaceae archaeon]
MLNKNCKIFSFLLLFAIVALLFTAGCTGGDNTLDTGAESGLRTITDMRGVSVEIPEDIERVVIVDDGFVEGLMYNFGIEDRIVGLGGECPRKVYEYSFETSDGETYNYSAGMNPVRYLMPWLVDIPLVTDGSTGINYETLASLDPDVVIIREGASSFRAGSDENLQKTFDTLFSLGIPTVVLVGPPFQENPDIENIDQEIMLVGEIFGKEPEAKEIADYLNSQVAVIRERTADVSEDEKPRVMQFGLSPRARQGGGAGMAWGLDTIESYFIEDNANAKNAYEGSGAFVVISTEQILDLNPDVILLPTAQGYHPAKELYTAPYYENLQELSAVKNQRVYALPWTPYNWAKRLEYPIEAMVIAKASYPDRFADIDVSEWTLHLYKNVYGVDEETARELRSVQWLDWMEEMGF